MVLIIQLGCIFCNLGIQSTQVLACRLVQLNISAISIRFIVVVQRLAGDQLIRVGSCSRRRHILCLCSKCFAPGVFTIILSFRCSRFIYTRLLIITKLNIAVFIRLIDFDVISDIAGIFFSILLQLFHDDHIVIFNTVSDFDEAVVGSLRIRVLGYGFRGLRIVVGRAIGIGLAVRTLFPVDGIAGDITCIMTKSNGVCFIGRGLVADSRAVFRGYHSLAAGSQ